MGERKYSYDVVFMTENGEIIGFDNAEMVIPDIERSEMKEKNTMANREKVKTGLTHCANLDGKGGCDGCPYDDESQGFGECIKVLLTETMELLADVTNPKGGMCFTCKHESEKESTYCVSQQKCRVCGCCTGYERRDDDG